MVRLLAPCLVVVSCAAPPPSPKVEHAPPAPAPAAVAHASPTDAGPPAPPGPPCNGNRFGLSPGADAITRANIDKKRGTMGTATKQIVAASHYASTEAGLAVLRAGGSAADAFVAAALVDDLVFPGVTSLAGLAGILVYDAKAKSLTYVHGGLADPVDPARRYRAGDVESGRLVLVPGAPAAYAEVVRRFGRKSLREDVEPAASLASKGFPVDALYAHSLAHDRAKLEGSAFGRSVFFRDGKLLREGDTLRMEETAKTLRAFARDPRWFYKGPWVTEAVRVANEHGGTLDPRDFAAYAPEVGPAVHARFMGQDVYAGGFGGVTLLSSLVALEQARPGPPQAFTSSADDLELLLRIARATRDDSPAKARGLVSRGSSADAIVTSEAARLVALVKAQRPPVPTQSQGGSHSSAVVVVDAEGNVVVGTHSIEALNWGEGLFAFGIPLSTAAPVGIDDAPAATLPQRSDPLSDTIVMKDGAPRAALAVYGSGLYPGDVQVLDALLARGVDAEEAVLAPRVGYFEFDLEALSIDLNKSVVDPRFDAGLLCELSKRGFGLERSMRNYPRGFVDTGFPTLVTIAGAGGTGRLHGMTPDAPYVQGRVAGD
jgi:gamma-glutamyltranspeptidase / glutathione hydrolase